MIVAEDWLEMTEPLEARVDKLESAYKQIDRRLGSIEVRLDRPDPMLRSSASDYRWWTDPVLFGIILVVLVHIVIRVFFP